MFTQIGTEWRIVAQSFIHVFIFALMTVSLFFTPVKTASTELPKLLTTLQISIQKAVFYETQNEGCLLKYFTGETDHHGDSSVPHCGAGNRKQTEGEQCHGRYGCCVCEHGTYQPYPNTCMHCIQKKFCPDYELEFEDYGSNINNSRCMIKATETYHTVGKDNILLTTGTQDPDTTPTFQITDQSNIEPSSSNTKNCSFISLLENRTDLAIIIFCVIPVCAIVLNWLPFFFWWIIAWCMRQRMFLLWLCGEEYHETLPTTDPENKVQVSEV